MEWLPQGHLQLQKIQCGLNRLEHRNAIAHPAIHSYRTGNSGSGPHRSMQPETQTPAKAPPAPLCPPSLATAESLSSSVRQQVRQTQSLLSPGSSLHWMDVHIAPSSKVPGENPEYIYKSQLVTLDLKWNLACLWVREEKKGKLTCETQRSRWSRSKKPGFSGTATSGEECRG